MTRRTSNKALYTVLPEDAGATLAAFLAARLSVDEGAAARTVRSGAAYVDDRRETHPQVRLTVGQRVTLRAPLASDDRALRVVYRDDDLLVVDKPAGLPSTLPRGGAAATVESRLRELAGPGARLLHRLDQPASGLLLASVSPGARRALAAQVREHALQRCYAALVLGAPTSDEWVMHAPLRFDRRRQRAICDPCGKPAETHARVLRRLGPRTLLGVALGTGRTHQIRAHLAAEGLPLVGDPRYGGDEAPRLALHAHRLALRHPRGDALDLHCPLPADFRALLAKPA